MTRCFSRRTHTTIKFESNQVRCAICICGCAQLRLLLTAAKEVQTDERAGTSSLTTTEDSARSALDACEWLKNHDFISLYEQMQPYGSYNMSNCLTRRL